MRHPRYRYRLLCGAAVISMVLVMFVLGSRNGKNTQLVKSTCFCRGEGRFQICDCRDMCWTPAEGLVFVTVNNQTPLPSVVATTVSQESDELVPVKAMNVQTVHPVQYHTNETLLAASFYAAFHLTHFLSNGFLPFLERILESEIDPASVVMYTTSPWSVMHPEVQNHIDIFLQAPFGVQRLHQTVSATDQTIHCYPRVLLGMGNRCYMNYCQDQPSASVVQRIGATVARHYAPERFAQRRLNNTHIIIIARAKSSRRRFHNLAEILRVVTNLGLTYQVVEFEQMSLPQQIAVFVDASVVVAVHGNALGHILWMMRGAAVLEVMPHGFESPFLPPLGALLDLHYEQLHCSTAVCLVPGQQDTDVLDRDVDLDPDLFTVALSKLMAAVGRD
eukprot:TRINITY_DN2069_c0_g1_i5.p1 TRINITY_DN2069_c0_g1~~TRINITY_DN2069_c0_g1_i5.p1  ORF type:complete len:390 (+),score=18.91 TRINITY_DN2069_c0_g1_i5:266-1435(+)